MGREKESYRDILVRLDEAFPGKNILSIKELADYLGICQRTAKKHYFGKDRTLVMKEVAARRLAE